ncbi:MAG: hypothetical protein V1685_01470, partial [Parcubacteria group bacterium]
MKFLTPKCFTLKLRNEFCISLLSGSLWILATPVAWLTFSGTAEAGGIKYLLNCASNDNMSVDDVATWNDYIYDNGQWRPGSTTNDWTPGDGVTEAGGLADGPYTIFFKRIQGFYVPATESRTVTLDNHLLYTNSYHIYSNTLSVAVTGITDGASAIWRLTSYPANEYTNSSTYRTYGTVFTNTSPDYSNKLFEIPMGTYSIAFNSIRGYQSPFATNVNITGEPYDWYSTNTYVPYSNSLAVTIAGITTSTNVIWNLSGPGEFTNAVSYGTSFTNTYLVTLIPTGNYTVTFPAVSGYTTPTPNPASTNITTPASALTNNVTGLYARVMGTIDVTVSPTNGSWTFTTSPTDFTNRTTSALSGTNSATLTNAAIGVYTISYGQISGYGTPSPETKTNTQASTNLQFSGTYLLGSSDLTVQF